MNGEDSEIRSKYRNMANTFDPLQSDLDTSKDLLVNKDSVEIVSQKSDQVSSSKNESLLPWEENNGKIIETEAQTKSIDITDKKIIDINITTLEDITTFITEGEHDYVMIEPGEDEVKITFRQDNIDKVIKYIKFPTYTNILFKFKQVTGMVVENNTDPQEGKGKIKIDTDNYHIGGKTVPGPNGERIWIKIKEDISMKGKKKVQKTPLSTIFAFLGAILFVSLVLGGAFITFIILNTNDIEDVKFFLNLGINPNDINSFMSQIVTIIFSILVFICTIVLSVALFKFFLTKKTFRKKKITYALISTLLLFITFGTGSAWLVIDRKIKSFPNWQEKLYGDLKIFDNSLLISEDFSTDQALITQTENLIGPASLRFDLSNFQTDEAANGFQVKKYIWDFGDEQIESLSPEITKIFNEVGNYDISVIAIGDSIEGQNINRVIKNIPAISISHVIDVQEDTINNGGKKLSFNANSLENLGKIVWYFKEPTTESNPNPNYPEWTEISEGYDFIPGKIFFEEIYVGVSIIDGESTNPGLDKIIIISPDGPADIKGEIDYTQKLDNELSFEFFVKNPETDFSDGFIENYSWSIEEKTYNSPGNLEDTLKSPEIEHTFSEYGEHEIVVELTDSTGKNAVLRKTLNIQKRVQLRSPLVISDENGDELKDIRREETLREYYIDGLAVPSKLLFDSRYVRPINALYTLDSVEWDIGGDGDIDAKTNNLEYTIPTEGNHTIVANYTFVHRRNQEDVINMQESIYIEGIKKDAILNLKMEYDSNYAPVTVRFDASESFIKNDDIVKFIYDYGDGIVEERDAINPGHKYSKAGDYTVRLTVRGKTGKSYSTSRQLILLPPPQGVQISTSLKEAPIGQGIDFSSAESEGQIVEYFWDFGDGNISTEANPSHSYKKPGDYTVKLRADFANNNSITDELKIKITK